MKTLMSNGKKNSSVRCGIVLMVVFRLVFDGANFLGRSSSGRISWPRDLKLPLAPKVQSSRVAFHLHAQGTHGKSASGFIGPFRPSEAELRLYREIVLGKYFRHAYSADSLLSTGYGLQARDFNWPQRSLDVNSKRYHAETWKQ